MCAYVVRQPPTSLNNFHLPHGYHGLHSHGGHVGHGGHGEHGGHGGETGRDGMGRDTGRDKLTFKLDFPGNL